MVAVVTRSAAETSHLGERLGRLAQPGDFIALVGELGAGKTRFVRGVATGLGVSEGTPVTSPTYTLLHIYEGRLSLYHFDLYRLAGAEDAAALGFDDYFYGGGVSVVEWAERLGDELPTECLTISFAHAGEEERSISFAPSGERYRQLVAEIFPDGAKKCFDPLPDS